jgi:hypothetical protein
VAPHHNNLYRWHLSLLYAAVALEREDLIDWCFGYGDFTPEKQPDHSSLRKLAATHFLPDGAYWGLNSGYHLYPLHSFCEAAVFSHHLSQMDPRRFPPEQYDLTDRRSFGGDTIHRALHWFMSLAMPDRTMPTLGDSPAPRAGMDDYFTTAEVGYRFYNLKAVGDYEGYRNGQRRWAGLLYGAPEIVRHELPFTSSYLSSGWVSLRNDWNGNRVWVGLNALKKGSGHQHADRLNFVHYAHGHLLSIEKATPYNESVTRVLGTLSQAHNTVTVDKTSQKQGEALTPEEEPVVRFFHAAPIAQFAEVQGDHIYPGTSVYRRSVAIVEDIVIDCFRVEGGDPHDWMVNLPGPAPELSVTTTEGTFDPADWLANGTDHVLTVTTGDTWHATWRVEDVTSRLTMLGVPATTLYQLETYPIANARITDNDPPCQTLCVRREGGTGGPFLAVWDAWKDTQNLQDMQPGDTRTSLRIQTATNTYHVLFGPGQATFPGGTTLETDAAFALVRNAEAALLVGGALLAFDSPNGGLRLTADEPTTASAERRDGEIVTATFNAIHYDTYGGEDHLRDGPETKVSTGETLY